MAAGMILSFLILIVTVVVAVLLTVFLVARNRRRDVRGFDVQPLKDVDTTKGD